MKALDIELALAVHFNARVNIIVPNVSWGANIHECDMLVITRAGYAYEIEIKTTKADLKRDGRKRHGHNDTRIKALYFAMPKSLTAFAEYVPDRAGIIGVSGGFCDFVREAKFSNSEPFTLQEKFEISRLGTMRIWTLKEKIRVLRDSKEVAPHNQ